MAKSARDPYRALGVSADASDEELRVVYHRLVQLHHPDHNGGSPEAARRFEEIQDAYAQVRELRARAPRRPPPSDPAPKADSTPKADPERDSRLADLERQVREAQAARERARRAAREAAEQAPRPSDEELGYVSTDDSFLKIFADARSEIAARLAGARGSSATRRVSDLIDQLVSKVSGEDPDRRRDGS
jgi:curved DNA-binding protein CbpA